MESESETFGYQKLPKRPGAFLHFSEGRASAYPVGEGFGTDGHSDDARMRDYPWVFPEQGAFWGTVQHHNIFSPRNTRKRREEEVRKLEGARRFRPPNNVLEELLLDRLLHSSLIK